MKLKLALPGGRIKKVKAHFPFEGSPVGYRVLIEGKTAIVVGFAEEGLNTELVFPDRVPVTTEKHIRALIDTASYYGINPWLLLHRLLPSVLDWREEEYITVSEKPQQFLDRLSLQVLAWVKSRKKVKEENLKKRFGDAPVKRLMELGFLIKKKEWKMPSISEKLYRLALPAEEALQRLSRLKDKEEAIKLVYFLLERRYASEEELKQQGFSKARLNSLIKRGILVQVEKDLPQVNFKPPELKQKTEASLKPLGSKSVLMGYMERVYERLIEELDAYIEKKKSVLLFCDQLELLSHIYEKLYSVFGDRLVPLSSLQKSTDFIKGWFRVWEEEGLIVMGSRLSLLSPIKSLSLIVVFGDREPKLHDGTDLRHFLFELSRYYGANFCVASPLPPMSVCVKEGWEKQVFLPPAEVLVVKRKPEEVLTAQTVKLLKESLHEKNLLLVNKVGYAYAYCRNCGYILECPRCQTFLTISREKSLIFCNSCGYKSDTRCPECGGDLSELGFGIERATEEVIKIFGSLENIHISTQPQLDQIYDNVFVLHAENILSVPWYDSTERYFSYIWKSLCIARKRLVIQTVLENNPLLEYAKTKDWEGFCREELDRRKEENLPPYSRLVKVKTTREPDLSNLPVEILRKSSGNLKELIIKVDHKNFSSLMRFLRSLSYVDLQVL